jgi:hypothetical protein
MLDPAGLARAGGASEARGAGALASLAYAKVRGATLRHDLIDVAARTARSGGSRLSGRSADGHDVDPVDGFRLALHTRLDAADQRLDLSAGELIVNVKTRGNPRPARTGKVTKTSRMAVTPG